MKVVITWASTAFGGAEESVRTLAAGLAAQRLADPVVIEWATEPGAMAKAGERFDGRYVACRDYDGYCAAIERELTVGGRIALIANHRTYAADLTIAHRMGTPSIFVFRGIASPAQRHGMLDEATKSIVYKDFAQFDWSAVGQASVLVGISRSSTSSLMPYNVNGRDIVTIYNGAADRYFAGSLAGPRLARSKLLVACRLVAWKRVDLAIEILAIVRDTHPDVTMIIIGAGPMEQELRALAAAHGLTAHIDFQGWQGNPSAYYHDADCLLHCSPIEGFGRVVIEANAAALPSIGPAAGGVGELIEDGVTGYTFAPNDPADAAKKISRFLSSSPLDRLKMGNRARARAKALFHRDVMARNYARLCEQIQTSQTRSLETMGGER